ncbi:MAG: GNAT family N-acetyltransferase [Oscillospiraceae bacterium]|nr:GNAT family N-acetyltransferase [Oscillospiraceae bacterium]
MEKEIRCACAADIEPLKRLWAECFPKDTEYSRFFFERVFRLRCARVCTLDGEVAAMLHSFPYDFATPDAVLHAKYIYGVGTAKKYRGLGIAGELLENEANDCDFTVIIPQSESLFDFYKKHGFCELFKISRIQAAPGEEKTLVPAGRDDIQSLNTMYEKMCRGSIYPIRTPDKWETLIAEHEFLGGGISLFDGGYCVHYKNGEHMEISELCFPSGTSPFGYECVACCPGDETPIGAARLISERAREIFAKGYNRYLNLMHN